jgi:hypothetical protein
MTRSTAWDGTTPAADESNMQVLREAASFMLAETELDRMTRNDGGLYAYVEQGESGVVIRSTNNTTRWVFTTWPAIECYIESVYGLKEQDITDAAQLDDDKFEAVLRRGGLADQARKED